MKHAIVLCQSRPHGSTITGEIENLPATLNLIYGSRVTAAVEISP